MEGIHTFPMRSTQDDSVFPISMLLLDSSFLDVAPLRLRRFCLTRLELGKTALVQIEVSLTHHAGRFRFPPTVVNTFGVTGLLLRSAFPPLTLAVLFRSLSPASLPRTHAQEDYRVAA